MLEVKPRARGKYVHRIGVQLDDQNHETLHAYAAFIEESPDYVINELIDLILTKHKGFTAWRTEHPGPHAPRHQPSKEGAERRRGGTAPGVRPVLQRTSAGQ